MDENPRRSAGQPCGLDILQAGGARTDKDDLAGEFVGVDQGLLHLPAAQLLVGGKQTAHRVGLEDADLVHQYPAIGR